MISIRPALEADQDQILQIVNLIIAAGDAYYFEAPFSHADLERWLAAHTACFIAAEGTSILGGYLLRPNYPGRGSHIANASYFVAPVARGRGIGRLLGEHSLAEARRLGFAALQFNAVVSSNAAAVKLWESLGFRIIGASPSAFRRADGTLVDLLIMHRLLE
jgi:L-amino acid N-acyltransferase YncA